MSIGLARVTISAAQRRVDVALPEHVPLVELLPELLRHAGMGLADDGERHGGWLLRRSDGGLLAPAYGLSPQGVRDGDVLHLVPARAQWPELEYDDVVEAIADGARRRGAAWKPATTRIAALVSSAVALAAGVVTLLRGGPSSLDGYLALGIAAVLLLAAALSSRAYGDGLLGASLGGFALPYAFVGGAMFAAPGDPVGVLAPARWLGAAELLLGSVALLLAAVIGAVGVWAYLRVFSAGVTVGLFGACTALAGLFVSAPGAAAILQTVLVCGIGVLPLLAIRFGKLPMPPVTLPTGSEAESFTSAGPGAGDPARERALEAARERPQRDQVFGAVARTEELLTGMLIGHAILAVAASVVLVVVGGTASWLLVAVSSTATLLRSRLFVTVRQRVSLVAAAVAGLALLAVALAWTASADQRVILVALAATVALVTVSAGSTYSRRPPSPYLGRAADILDILIVVSVVPVACAVLGLYTRLRGLGG